MSDLDIVVKLDPGQPVAGAKAVTAEVAKLETQAKKTESAAAGIAKLNFKQAAAGAAQAFGLINEKLKLTDTEFGKMAESAVKFGAMGAQVAGPWGAVAGALLGVALEGEGTFEMLERLNDASKTTAERFADLTKDSSTFKGQLAAITTGAHSMAEAIELVTLHLQNLHTATSMFSSLGPVLAQINDQLAAQKKILGELNDPRNAFVLSMTALNQLFKNGEISAADYVTQQSKLATSFATHEGVVVKTAKAYKELEENQRRVFGGMAILTEANARIVDPRAAGFNENNEFVPTAQEWNIPRQSSGDIVGEENERELARQRDMMNARIGQAQAQHEWAKKSAEEAKKLEESIVTVNDIFAAELVSSASSFSDTLVDAANGADVSWKSFFSGMLVEMEKAILKAMILKALTGSVSGAAGAGGAYGGLFGLFQGLEGAAAGGTIMPSGGGTADTQTVAFRKRPDETVHINTPQQERAYQRGGSGGGSTTVQVIDGRDHRALMQGGPDVQRVVLDTVRANPAAFRALLGR